MREAGNNYRWEGVSIASLIAKNWTYLRNMGNSDFRDVFLKGPGPAPVVDGGARLARNREAIEAAVGWMRYIQGRQPDGGIAGFVWFNKGLPTVSGSYPETTGYSIPTMYDYASRYDDGSARAAAARAADFLLPLQGADGSFPGGLVGELTGPSVFNTAQVVDGLLRAYIETGDRRYRDAASKSCGWICDAQEEDGSWGRFNYLGAKRVYDTKVSEILLKVHAVMGGERLSRSAERNLGWVLSKQEENGWFNDCDNSSTLVHIPLTHTIGYTVQGLLESYLLLRRRELLTAAERTLSSLLEAFGPGDRLLSARYRSDWQPAAKYSCVTGDAQISICWSLLHSIVDDDRYLRAASRMNDLLASIQLRSRVPEMSGALTSSWPVNGDYFPYRINNWTVKYFVDALLIEQVAAQAPPGGR